MKKTCILFSLLFVPLFAFATAQMGELLLYEGKTNEMYSCPLEPWFATSGTGGHVSTFDISEVTEAKRLTAKRENSLTTYSLEPRTKRIRML